MSKCVHCGAEVPMVATRCPQCGSDPDSRAVGPPGEKAAAATRAWSMRSAGALLVCAFVPLTYAVASAFDGIMNRPADDTSMRTMLLVVAACAVIVDVVLLLLWVTAKFVSKRWPRELLVVAGGGAAGLAVASTWVLVSNPGEARVKVVAVAVQAVVLAVVTSELKEG